MSLGTITIALWSYNRAYSKSGPKSFAYIAWGSRGNWASKCEQQKLKEVTQQLDREQADEREHINKYKTDAQRIWPEQSESFSAQ